MWDKCRLTCIGEIQEKETIKSIMKRQVFSSSWVLECFLFCFFVKMSTSYVAWYVIYSCRKTWCSSKFCNIHRKTPVLESLFNKVSGLKACIFIEKYTPTQLFSYEYYKIFKNNFFMEHLFIILLRNFMWWCILDIWRLYFTIVKLGHISERTSR